MSNMHSIYFPDSVYFDASFLDAHLDGWNIVVDLAYNSSVIVAIIRPPEVAKLNHIQFFPNLKYVLSDSTGVSHLSFLKRFNHIFVRTLRDLPSSARSPLTTASDHAFCLAELSLRPILPFYSNLINSNISDKTPNFIRADFRGLAWQEVSVGIVGFGRIGQAFLRRLPHHVREVFVFDIDEARFNCLSEHQKVVSIVPSIEEVFQRSDVVLLSVTDSPNNINLISTNCFQYSIHSLINISRSYMVDSFSLLSALNDHTINMYFSDFLPGELHSEFIPFVRNGRMLYLPHMGGCTKFSWDLSLMSILSFLPLP